jgi:membrane protease YdiL (CAAX protease family)
MMDGKEMGSMLKTTLLLLGRGVALLAVVYLPVFAAVSAFFASGLFGLSDPKDAGGLVAVLVIVLSFGTAMILISVVAARFPQGFRGFGFRATDSRYLWWALGLGLVSMIAFGLIESVLPAAEVSTMFNLGRWQIVALFWVGAPIQEEVIFRGLVQTTLEKKHPGPINIVRFETSVAALVTALLFAVVHSARISLGDSWAHVALIVAGALVLGLLAGHLRWKSGSLLPCMLIHSLFNILG